VLKRVLNEKLSSYAFYAQYFQNEQGCRVQKLARKSIFELAANSSAVCGEIMKKNAPYGGRGKEKIKVFDKYIYKSMFTDGKSNESINAKNLINKDKIPEQDDSLIIDTYIEKIQMPICSYVLFIVFSVFAIGLLIFLWMNVRQYGNQDIFIITSIFVGIMTVLIVAFALINLVFSEESRKYALLTYAYDEALKKVGERYDKKTIATSRNDNTESKKEEIEYGVLTITKTFESYCQNITAK